MRTIASLLVILLGLSGCNSGTAENKENNIQQASAPAGDEQLFTQASGNLVSQFRNQLQSTLLGAINENGTAYALQICQLKAPEIAAAHSVAGWTVKRVSNQWRSVADKPDSTEKAVLERFADPATKTEFIVQTAGPDSARTFHYYEKIMVKEMCLQCHGDIQTVDQDLWKFIKLTYPYDKATGYKVGDLRGMYVVEAPFPSGEDIARLLAQGVAVSEISAATPPPPDSSSAK